MLVLEGVPNSLGLFHEFLDEENVKIYGIEAGGKGLKSGQHASSLLAGKPGVFCMEIKLIFCKINMDKLMKAHSISAGLDYPGIGPEHSWLKDIGE